MTRMGIVALVGVVTAAAGGASADKVVLNGGPGYGGGSFGATITTEAGSPFGLTPGTIVSTRTFCVETEEYFNPGTQYYVEYALSAVNGGGGAVGGEDQISRRTAWMFSQALSGILQWDIGSGLTTFDINNATHNRAVQEAIWAQEQETYAYSGALTTVGKIRDNILAQASLVSENGNLFGVLVMRLWSGRTSLPGGGYSFSGNKQDQLVLIPLPPAAWAGMSMLTILAGAAAVRRRLNRA
jgi:hypothetical protein